MGQLWNENGMSMTDAENAIDIISKYEDIFVDIMMVEELGMMIEDESPWKHG